MDNRPPLTLQKTHNAIRRTGINPNYWYPVAWAEGFKPGNVVPVTVWNQNMVVFRSADGSWNALDNACLHKGVELHMGEVEQNHIVCPYHGWAFDGLGRCIRIPYLPEGRKCPAARIRAFPVQEQFEIVWVFPGDPDLADQVPLPEVPEFDQPGWLMVKIPGHFKAHFSSF